MMSSYFCFFFFKQKTAYEMRISDWSSDVCSSDLVNFGEITRQFAAHLQTKPNFSLKLSSEVRDITRNEDGTWRVSYKNLKDGSETETDAKFEIGRASCRERVCQYV